MQILSNPTPKQKIDRSADYAVDRALHYASHLIEDFNVLAIGVSSTDRDKSTKIMANKK
ncbi:MAG: hypothetical protein ACR2P7_07850 [bacterium]